MKHFWHLTTVLALCSVCMPQSALACTRAPGGPQPYVPSDGSELPANMVEWVMHTPGDHSSLRAWADAPDGETREVSVEERMLDPFAAPFYVGAFAEYRITEALAVGSTLRIGRIADGAATDPEIFLRYKIAPEASVPSSMKLGEIEAQQETGLVVVGGLGAGGLCSRELEDASFARIGLQLNAAAKAFEPLLRYQLRVDDQRIWSYDDGQEKQARFWTSSLGAGQDLVYVACHGELSAALANVEGFKGFDEGSKKALVAWIQALEPGAHRIRMVGLLPDDRELVSNEVTVDLRCAHDEAATEAVDIAADGGAERAAAESCSVASGAGAPSDASVLPWLLLALVFALRSTRNSWRRRAPHPRCTSHR